MPAAGGATPPVPSLPVTTPAQAAGRKAIDDAKSDFSQAMFRDVPDWSLANDDERLALIEEGHRSRAALGCWASFGDAFTRAVDSHGYLWTRSVDRGADPENVPQTAGRYKKLKQDVLALVRTNLEKNEDRVVAEFAEFGIIPPFDLLRPGSPAKRELSWSTRPAAGRSGTPRGRAGGGRPRRSRPSPRSDVTRGKSAAEPSLRCVGGACT